jgi:hypothetical protein
MILGFGWGDGKRSCLCEEFYFLLSLSCPSLFLVGIDSHKHTHIVLTLSLSLSLFGIYVHLFVFLGFMAFPFHPCGVCVSVPPFWEQIPRLRTHRCIVLFMCVFMGRLYESRAWEDKAVRKLIAKGQVAALSKGYDYSTPDEGALHECPICFLYYPTMNTTSCCHANICTECYLQVRPQPSPGGALKKKTSSPTVPCPFCNQLPHHHKTFQIQVVTVTSQELLKQQVQELEQEQQWAHLQRLKADQQHQQHQQSRERTHSCSTSSGRSTPTTGLSSSFRDANNNNNNGSQEETFGSCLDQDERVALFRKRSESVASSNNGGNGGGGGGSTDGNSLLTLSSPLMTLQQEVQVIQSIAMTPEERMQLEQEMKNQQLHPLALKVEMEAEQRRAMNEQRHFQHQQQQQQQHRTTHRSHQSRDWNSIINAYFDAQSNETTPDSTTNATTTSSNDRHGRFTSSNNNNNNNRRRGESINDLMALEAALVFAMQRGRHRDPMVQPPQEQSGRGGPSTGTSTSTATTSTTDNDTQSMTNRRLIDLMNRSWAAHPLMAGGANARNHPLSTMDRPRAIPRTSSSPPRPNSSTRATTTTTTRTQSLEAVDDTVSWLMQGLSEEEQLAIAIAASLQEQQQQQEQHVAPSSSDDDDDDIDSVEDLGNVDTLIASTVAQHAIEELSSVVNDDPVEVEEVAAIQGEEVAAMQGATVIESDFDSAALENDDDDDIPLNHDNNRDDEV